MNEQPNPNEDIARAVQLMRNAGWVDRGEVEGDFTGLRLTPAGQEEALRLHQTYRKLRCESAQDIYSVLVVLHWYLFNDNEL